MVFREVIDVSSEKGISYNHTVAHAQFTDGGNFPWMWGERTAENTLNK
jgi:hypothetical protein